MDLISFKGKLPPWHRIQKWGPDLESNQKFLRVGLLRVGARWRRCRESNPGCPCEKRGYLPLYDIDMRDGRVDGVGDDLVACAIRSAALTPRGAVGTRLALRESVRASHSRSPGVRYIMAVIVTDNRQTYRPSRGIGWSRTNTTPVNSRSALPVSYDPKCRRFPGSSGRGAAPSLSFVVHYARAKSAMTGGVDVSKPTTSSMPASFGSAMLNPFDVIPTTTSLAGMPRASRYARRA